MMKKNNDFSFEDTDPEGIKIQDSRKFTMIGLLKDIVSLVILVIVIYSLYFSGYTYYKYQKMKDNVENAALLASKSSDDNAIKKYLSSFCVISEDYYCRPDFIEIDRDFSDATIKMKFKYRFMAFSKFPITITFNPEVKSSIE
jgi:hypothetical protein